MGTQLEIVSFLPLPLLSALKEHYLPFSALYGEIPNEKDLPSHQTAGDAEVVVADAKHKPPFVSSKVCCAFMHYTSFSGRRMLFCQICVMTNYTCGSPLFPPISPVVGTIVVRQNINCSTPTECQY